jgi:hypothetical protein
MSPALVVSICGLSLTLFIAILAGVWFIIRMAFSVGGIAQELRSMKDMIRDSIGTKLTEHDGRLNDHDRRLGEHDVKIARLETEVEA